MDTAGAALAGAVQKLKGMSGVKKGLELAKVAQEYAQQQGLPLGGNKSHGHGHGHGQVQGQGQGQSQNPLTGLATGLGFSSSGFNPSAAGTAAATAASFGGLSAIAGGLLGGDANNAGATGGQGAGSGFPGSSARGQTHLQSPPQPTLQRSHSFSGTGNFTGFGQQGGGFNTAAGFSSQPGTPSGFPGQAAPGFHSQPNYSGQHNFFQQGYGTGFSGAMTTQGQPPAYGTQSWQPWGQQTQPAGTAYTGGYSQMATAQGYPSGSQSARGSGDFWQTAGIAAGAGLAGAGLATAYNQNYGGNSGYSGGYGMVPPGFHQAPSAQYGGPMTLPNLNGKGGGGGGKNKGGGGKSKNKGGGGGVVTEQPQGVAPVAGWLHVPPSYELPEGIPKGLEILAMVDGLMVHQEVETLEAIANAIGIGYEGNNQYKISNRAGVHVYQAVEDTGFCWRCCCTQLRPVHMKVYDQTGSQVLAFQRHFRCFPCAWFEPCRENVTVFHGPKEDNKVIGRVTQSCCGGCCTPKLNILSRKGDRELVVKGPCVIGDCCGVRFDVLTDNKKKVGEVKKLAPQNLADIAKEIATDADKFTISFPQDLKVETKATALVALLVVDLLFFEYGGNTNRNLDGTCTIDLCVMFCCGCPIPCRVTVNGMPELGGKGAPAADQIER